MKLPIAIPVVIMVLFVNYYSRAQNNDTQAALYNIGLGSFFGGFGAVINKQKDEKVLPVFLKGFTQGGVGGYINFQSKKFVYEYSKSGSALDAWAAKLINSMGNSIIHNAASNKDFWEQWNFTFGFNRLEFNFKNRFTVNYKVMPLSLYGVIFNSFNGKFDLSTSLEVGQFVFRSDDISIGPDESEFDGVVVVNSMRILNDFPNSLEENKTIAHELIHIYQYEDYANINPFFIKPRANFINNDNKWVKLYNKWTYTDFNGLFLWDILYSIESIEKPIYYNNFFEKEADYYSFKNAQ